MTILRSTLLSMLILCVATRALHAQDPRLMQRLDPQTAVGIQALVDSARGLSLPAEPIVQKALEGASKGADGQHIITVVRNFIAELGVARTVLGSDVSPDALVLAAAALDGGVSSAQLRHMRPYGERRSFNGGLAGLIYLMSRGVSPEQSLTLVEAMLQAGLTGTEFTSLQQLVEQDVRGGASASESARVRAHALIQHASRFGQRGIRDD